MASKLPLLCFCLLVVTVSAFRLIRNPKIDQQKVGDHYVQPILMGKEKGTPACNPPQLPCADDKQCCTYNCTGGVCQCKGRGIICNANSDCCSKNCTYCNAASIPLCC